MSSELYYGFFTFNYYLFMYGFLFEVLIQLQIIVKSLLFLHNYYYIDDNELMTMFMLKKDSARSRHTLEIHNKTRPLIQERHITYMYTDYGDNQYSIIISIIVGI